MNREPMKSRENYKVWREIGTRWADNDAYGHVNNTIYYAWFDTAVNAWLIEQDLLDVTAGDPIGLVVETGCRYAKPLSFPQLVDIGFAVEAIGNSSVRYRLGVFAQNRHEASAEGYFVHVCVSREGRRRVPLPPRWRAAFAAIAG